MRSQCGYVGNMAEDLFAYILAYPFAVHQDYQFALLYKKNPLTKEEMDNTEPF